MIGLASGQGRTLLLVYAGGAVLFVARALWAGQDANWDLQNYHDYAAYALLHGRYSLDVGPGAFQAYLNPLPYIVPYALRAALPPAAAATALAMLQAAVVPLAWLVASALPSQIRHGWLVPLVGTAVGVTAAIPFSEVGTSFADLPTACLVLAGLAALLRAGGDARRPLALLAAAGACVGLATGFKLTNGAYAIGLAAATLPRWRPGPVRAAAASSLAAGLGAGFAVTGGVWGAWLWWQLGNPVFPGFNAWFHAPSAAASNFTDPRFLPHSLGDAMMYPLRIAWGEHPTAENGFADSRLTIALALTMVALLLAPFRRVSITTVRAAAFLWASYVPWLAAFSIQRYAAAGDILAGILLVHLAATLAPARFALPTMAALAAAALATTRPADWWHRPWTSPYTAKPPPGLTEPAAFLTTTYPSGYWASALSPESRFYSMVPVGIATGGVLRERLVDGLRHPPGGVLWTFGYDMPLDAAVRTRMAEFGLVPSAPCLRAPSLWWVDTVFCRATPSGPVRLAAAVLHEGEAASFTSDGSGWIYELSGWANAGADGIAASAGPARLVLRPERRGGRAMLEFEVRAPRGSRVTVAGEMADTAAWALPAGEWVVRSVCLPAAQQGDGVAVLTLAGPDGQAPSLTLRSMTLHPDASGACG